MENGKRVNLGHIPINQKGNIMSNKLLVEAVAANKQRIAYLFNTCADPNSVCFPKHVNTDIRNTHPEFLRKNSNVTVSIYKLGSDKPMRKWEM